MPTIYFVLTELCNLSCPSCIRNNISNTKGEFHILNLDTIISFVRQIHANSIVITGGEPFLYDEWELVLSKCLEEVKNICICTNGMLSDEVIEKLEPFLAHGVKLQISIDGDEVGDARMRGNKHFVNAINIIKKLKRFSDSIVISTTVDKRNVQGVLRLIEILNSLNFSYWKVSWVQSLHPQIDKYALNYQEWNNFVDMILPMCYFRVHISKLFDFNIFDKYKKEPFTESITKNCGAGKNKLYIFPNGDVYPCSCVKDWKLGNVYMDQFDSICSKLSTQTQITIPLDSICYKCKYVNICNSGCPGYSYKVFGKIGYGDIRCPFVKNEYDKKY